MHMATGNKATSTLRRAITSGLVNLRVRLRIELVKPRSLTGTTRGGTGPDWRISVAYRS